MAIALRKYYNKNNEIQIPKSFILGSFAPDILLYFVVLFSYLYYQLFTSMNTSEIFSLMFDTLYFTDSLWIFSYNVLHSPFIVIAALCFIYAMIKNNTLLYRSMNKLKKNEKMDLNKVKVFFPNVYLILFFFLGCLFHISFDIPVHFDDGPLLLYPINDELRYYSPISYWDPNHYGNEFMIFEMLLLLGLIGYLIKDKLLLKFSKKV